MKVKLAIAACVLLGLAETPVFPAETVTLRSRSGQFILRGVPLNSARSMGVSTSAVAYVRLDPALLGVSCERIKEALLAEIGMKDEWRGAVSIFLHPVRADNETIVVTSLRFAEGWTYRLDVPEHADPMRLIKAIVQVLLLEIVNRGTGQTPAELPPWLAEGLSAELQATALANFTLEPETRIVRSQHYADTLRPVREAIRAHAALTFNELNFPTDQQSAEPGAGTYNSCARLLVHELLRLKDGRESLREMLVRLPENLNWQTAFLRAFHAHFQTLLDADKWWALMVVHTASRDNWSDWPGEETLRQLDALLSTRVQSRRSAGELPVPSELKLQQVVAEWDAARQIRLLSQKVNLLLALRLRAPPELLALVDSYLQASATYLSKLRDNQARSAKNVTAAAARVALSDFVRKLDELDAKREVWRENLHSAPASQLGLSQDSSASRGP